MCNTISETRKFRSHCIIIEPNFMCSLPDSQNQNQLYAAKICVGIVLLINAFLTIG